MRKAIVVALLVALALLLAVPATANAGSSRYQFPKGAKITVTVGAPDEYGVCPVHFAWPAFSKPGVRYGVRASARGGVHTDEMYTDDIYFDVSLPPGNWTVVVAAYDGPSSDPPWKPGPVLGSLKASFRVP